MIPLKDCGKGLRTVKTLAVKTYSVKKDGDTYICKNFKVKEFACKDGSDTVLIDGELAELLQKIREHFGAAVTINSAYRNAAYNKKVGGVSNSQHVKGTAADIVVKGVEPKTVAQYAEHIMPGKGGIGLYSAFTHVDVRANRSRWQNFGREIAVSGFAGYKEKELESAAEIVKSLNERGIMTNSALWNVKCASDTNAYWLAKKICNMTVNGERKPKLDTVNDIVWGLNHRGIILDMPLWLKLFEEDKDLYWLGFKAVNMTKNEVTANVS